MTLKQVLGQTRAVFTRHNIEEPRLESELLLRRALGISQVQLYQDLHRELSAEEEADFKELTKRRLSGEPIAYITGHREFYGLDFYVGRSVLIPRPESELLVEKALYLAQCYPISTIADIGTGSGAIAISLALNLPQAKIYATDISAPALKVALFNSQKHGVVDRVYLLHGDMLNPLPEPVDLIIANLPYVTESEVSQMSPANFEPQVALNGGWDGLEKIRQLCQGVTDKLHPGGYLLLEIGQGQSRAVTTFLGNLFPSARIEITPDLSGIDRVVSLTFTSKTTVNQGHLATSGFSPKSF